jgi:glucose/mannose-6-phosphate isomerase
MNLDDSASFAALDSRNLLADIDGLPDQLREAWALGQSIVLRPWEAITQVLLVGMGGSAIGAELLAAYIAPHCTVPVTLLRNYMLPEWASGPGTLVICSSYSGNTEETISAFRQAKEKGCRVLVITTGGQLAAEALESGTGLWIFNKPNHLGVTLGYSFGLLLAAFTCLGLIPNPEDELVGAITAMRLQQRHLQAEVPVMENPAKRLAGQCFGRIVAVFGADFLVPVARYWQGQISTLARSWAHAEELPEANHNILAGVLNPEPVLSNLYALFLRADRYHPRNLMRANLTKEILMLEAIGTDFFDAPGKNPLEHIWTALHFGDYLAYYLAMAYGVDPTGSDAIVGFKMRIQMID